MATDTDIPRTRQSQHPDDWPLAPTAELEEHHLLDFLLLLAEERRAILTTTALLTIVGILLAFLLPVRYTATVTILPPQQGSPLGSALASQMEGLGSIAALAGGGLGLKNSNDMYVAMLKSQAVEDGMIRQFDLMNEYHRRYISDARKTFEHRASIVGGLKDGLIHISIQDPSRQRASDMANAYVEQLRDLSKHLAITEASQRRVFFSHQLDETKDNLTNAEEAMERAEKQTGLIQLDSQARALIESGAMLRAQIAAKEVQIEGMRTYATGQNAAVAQAQQELAGMQAQLAKLGGSEGNGSDEMIVPKGQLPAAGLEYLRRLRDVRYYEAEFGILARQLELAKLDEAKEGTLIQIVDPAVVPDKRSSPHRVMIIASAAFCGIIIGTLIVLLRAGIERSSRNPMTSEKLIRLKLALALKRRRVAP